MTNNSFNLDQQNSPIKYLSMRANINIEQILFAHTLLPLSYRLTKFY